MKKEYEITYDVTGTATFKVMADSLEDAQDIADYLPLEDAELNLNFI